MHVYVQGNAPPCRVLPLTAILLALYAAPWLARAQDAPGAQLDLPPHRVELWETVVRQDLTHFAWFPIALGDINDDGYDDFAMASKTDTTYIFLGGNPLNHQHAYIVRGGSAGIVAADFNRDGRMDIATAIQNFWYTLGEYSPEKRGAIRVFLQREGPERFVWQEDMLIEGQPNDLLGKNNEATYRSSLFILDFNGDGWPDLLTNMIDERDTVSHKAVLFLGGPSFDATYDAVFRVNTPRAITEDYVIDIHTGDLNGDGYDDVMIAGRSGPDYYWDVYLGNPWTITVQPSRTLDNNSGWVPQRNLSAMMDVNGDGYADIIDAGYYSIRRPFGDALVFLGRATLPERFLPSDSIPNLNPHNMGDREPRWACPVGDMNGDGYDDLCLSWAKALLPEASGFYFYPGGQLYRYAKGYFGILPVQDYVEPAVYNAGDVNGDGLDDIIAVGLGRKHGPNNRFQIWIGSRKLSTDAETAPLPAALSLDCSPNPLPASTGMLRVSFTGPAGKLAHLALHDLLGRCIHSDSVTFSNDHQSTVLNLAGTPSGVYLLSLRQHTNLIHRTLIVY